MRRGRPKHPDILTPREWEVLSLLREGLTNPQIAERLGISENGAKYHVLEILSKLGVSSRYEAAAWQREPEPVGRRFAGLAALFALRPPKLGSVTASKLALGALAVTAFGFLGLLAAGVLIMEGRASGSSSAPASVTPVAAAQPSVTPPATATATATPTSTAKPPASSTPSPTVTTSSRGVIAPPQTVFPTFVPEPTATLPPNVLTELPAGATQALEAFAAGEGTAYVGPCAPEAVPGQLCYMLQDGTPVLEGANIRVRLRVVGQLMAYDVVLAPNAASGFRVESASVPTPFTIPPP